VLHEELAIRSPSIRIAAPEVILLARYDRVPCHEAPFTRRNLFLRDDFTCQYCGRRTCSTDRLSVDHVLPRSRGGNDDVGELRVGLRRPAMRARRTAR
jgi:5-methylcytosine-specific restriction endonuclease McrA